MKKITYLTFVIFTIVIAISSCKKDNGDNLGLENPYECIEVKLGVDDSLTIIMQDSVIYSSDDYYYEMEYGSGKVYKPGATNIRVSNVGNIIAEIAPYEFYSSWSGHYRRAYAEDLECSIVSVGSLSGLSDVESIPERGWANQVALNQSYGYVVKMEGEWYYGHFCKYARIYIKQSLNGIVTIQYQPNWKVTYTSKKIKRLMRLMKDQYLRDII